MCEPDSAERAQDCGQPLLNFPLVVRLQCVSLLLHIPGVENLALRHETSDDLSRILSMQAQKWRLRACTYVLLSPRKMQVTGFEAAPAFDVQCGGSPTARAPSVRMQDRELLAQLSDMAALDDLPDPFSDVLLGRHSSQAPGRGRPPQRRGASSTSAGVPPAPIANDTEAVMADDEDIFGVEEEDDDTERSQAHLLAAPPPVDEELRRLSKDMLIEAVPQLDLMGDECADEDTLLEAPNGLGGANVGPTSSGAALASTAGSSGDPTSNPGAGEQVDVLADLLGEIVDMSEAEPRCDAPAVAPTMPSASSSSASSPPGPPSTAGGQQPQEANATGIAALPPQPQPAMLVGDAIPEAPEGWSMRFVAAQALWFAGYAAHVYAHLQATSRRTVPGCPWSYCRGNAAAPHGLSPCHGRQRDDCSRSCRGVGRLGCCLLIVWGGSPRHTNIGPYAPVVLEHRVTIACPS